MVNLPKSAAIKYAYGLHMVRQTNLSKAVVFFEESMLLSPDDAQYAYTFVLAMDGTGQSTQALTTLKMLILNYPDKGQLRELGLYLSQYRTRAQARLWSNKALIINPFTFITIIYCLFNRYFNQEI